MEVWAFDFEVNRCRPIENLTVRVGRVTVLADGYRQTFNDAFGMVYGLRGVEMVTDLVCIDWPEQEHP